MFQGSLFGLGCKAVAPPPVRAVSSRIEHLPTHPCGSSIKFGSGFRVEIFCFDSWTQKNTCIRTLHLLDSYSLSPKDLADGAESFFEISALRDGSTRSLNNYLYHSGGSLS